MPLSVSQRSQEEQAFAKPFALDITVAWTVILAGIIVEVGVLNVPPLGVLWIPMVATRAVGLAYGVYLYLAQRTDMEGPIALSNPFELGPALMA